jgi:HK97 family phage major capsid protein
MSKSLVELLQERQEADKRELGELLAKDADAFTQEDEARAVALGETCRNRQAEIDKAKEAEARAEAANTAAVENNETGTEERVAPAVVTREERTYTAEKNARGEASFFADAWRMQQGDVSARERLERHGREVVVEGEGVSKRATTTSSFAGLVVPQYLVDLAAPVAQAGRPFANTCQGLSLPEQGMVFYITRGTTAAATAVQATQNTAVQNTDQVFSDIQVNVQTIAGQQEVSRQSLERGTPGLDSLVYLDLAGSYAVNVDTRIITGTGTGTLGIQNAGGTQATAFTAAATPATFYTKTAGAVNSVLTGRFLPPTYILMHPRRWAWLIGQSDSTNRPLVVPVGQNPQNALANFGNTPEYGQVVGFLQGLPVVTDANVPTAVGTGPEDLVFVYRHNDCLLWEEGDGLPRQLRFDERLGNQLTVNLVVYGYIAFTAQRYPSAVSIVGGNAGTAGFGLVAPTF